MRRTSDTGRAVPITLPMVEGGTKRVVRVAGLMGTGAVAAAAALLLARAEEAPPAETSVARLAPAPVAAPLRASAAAVELADVVVPSEVDLDGPAVAGTSSLSRDAIERLCGIATEMARAEQEWDRSGSSTFDPRAGFDPQAGVQGGTREFEREDEASAGLVVSNPYRPAGVSDARVVTRGRTGALNVRARSIGHATAARELVRIAEVGATSGSVATPLSSTAPLADASDAILSTPAAVASGGLPPVGRSLLFVWNSADLADPAERTALIDFALDEGIDTIALDATAVGYGLPDALDVQSAFSTEARAAGLRVHALIGYPWFTVGPGAGLPGQPTSYDEGLAMIETIVATGLFDGVVDDSQPYGVQYYVDRELQNWLFDEPDRAAADMTAYLGGARVLLGDLELVKTCPFWYDSDARLLDVRDAAGEPLGTFADVVAAQVDLTLVMAYRDTLDGPNGILELVSGEADRGPMIVSVETSDLGSALDFLTYFEEGYDVLAADLERVASELAGTPGYRGASVHHYEPLRLLASASEREAVFGLVGVDRVRLDGTALVDSYDSRVGAYDDQVGYDPLLDRFLGGGEGRVLSNKRVQLRGTSVVHGDVDLGEMRRLRIDAGATVTGEVRELSPLVELPGVDTTPVDSTVRYRVKRGQSQRLVGDQTFDRMIVQRDATLVIEGPAVVRVNRLNVGRGGSFLVDVSRGPVELVAIRTLQLRDAARMETVVGSPADVRFVYAGKNLRLRSGATMHADVLAPRANVRLDGGAHFYGRAVARRLTLKSGSGAHLDRALLDVPML
ncbi:MAG: polymer-forming cytoskeletal protein [Planctomycetota bacterium]